MTPASLNQVLKQCEDRLFPALSVNVRERALYYHLLRHTWAVGRESSTFALSPLAKAIGVSESSIREDIRSLHSKGCISIAEKSRSGHLVRVFLPTEISGVSWENPEEPKIDIESLDFFSDRRFLPSLLRRERDRCFYCLRSVTAAACQLDHVIPQANGVQNGYRNIVVACHECNTTKRDQAPDDFLRSLYRRGVLSSSDLEERSAHLQALQTGKSVPDL